MRLAETGADVAICDKWTEGFAEVTEGTTKFGAKAIAVKADLGVMSELHDLVDHVKAEFGRLDILVNNAAVSPFYGQQS